MKARSKELLDRAIAATIALDSIGFTWTSEAVSMKWREMYERLKQYRSLNGDADVPSRWKQDLELATWVQTQRARKKLDG